ncbi:36696_t:CDS:2 [Gigaspora margarita]|uniref:36696_t:CDS:1 n=1 Tax=Gigaspora margarita TaxID=4874 RepID=A0ABN7URD8_GIGMA|nr:36696_t:CDS:2 [Gigaspora margarita]
MSINSLKFMTSAPLNLPDATNSNASTQDQTNTSSPSVYNVGITQDCEKQTNSLQYNEDSVKENQHPVSPVFRHKKNRYKKKCRRCNYTKFHYDENSNQCKDCYWASTRILSGNKLIDDFIESTQTSYRNYEQAIYSSRPLTPLISRALTPQSMDLDVNLMI